MERSWTDVQQMKDGKRSILGGTSLEKSAIYFTSAKLREANISQNAINSDNTDFFGDGNMKSVKYIICSFTEKSSPTLMSIIQV